MLSSQEIFNTVATHLLTQCEKSTTPRFEPANPPGYQRCLYRGARGLKCAVGALIPDALYNPQMENTNVRSLFEQYPELGEVIGGPMELLQQLQEVHDDHEPAEWLGQLASVAYQFRLDSSVLSAFKRPS